jgi:two-component system response regulator PilR (NtrC family)
MRLLERYAWPGNVRELENLIERAVALSATGVITAADLPAYLAGGGESTSDSFALPEQGLDLDAWLERVRTEMMRQALERSGGVQTQAAEMLGMSFRSFRYYAKKSGLTAAQDDG